MDAFPYEFPMRCRRPPHVLVLSSRNIACFLGATGMIDCGSFITAVQMLIIERNAAVDGA